MKHVTSIVLFIIVLISFSLDGYCQEKFIYLHDEKTFLQESSNSKLLVKFRKNLPASTKESIFADIDSKEILQKEKLGKSDNFEIELKESNKKTLYKDKLSRNKDIQFVSEYFKMKENEIIFSGIIAVKLKDISMLENFYHLVEISDLKVIKQNEVRNSVFYLSMNERKQDIDIIQTANALFESGLFEYSYPDIILDYKTFSLPSDTYINDQWAIQKINLENVWTNYTTGNSDIRIAIIDCGVNYLHNDLFSNYSGFGYDALSLDSVGLGLNETGDNHGTNCAGVAIAKGNNGMGIAGTAYNCSLIPIRISRGNIWASGVEIGMAIDYAASYLNSDILSLSWGNKSYYDPEIKNAIDNAYTTGRSGLGALIVAASGNSTTDDTSYSIAYPARADNVIAVGSSTSNDMRASTSCYLNGSISFVAPGENIKTTQPGNTYTTVSGTSLSCPLVAGVAALLLSKDPSLTNYKIKKILAETCDKPYAGGTYTYSTNKEFGGWNQEMGYGRINALSAMQALTNGPLVSGEIPSDNITVSYFGRDLKIYKDWLICGAQGSKKVYIYKFENNAWVLKQTLTSSILQFGRKLSIYDDQLAISSLGSNYTTPYSQYGSVYIYRLVNGIWTYVQEIVSPTGCQNFGVDLSIFNDYLAVSGHDTGGTNKGTFIYKRTNNTYVYQSKLTDTNYPNAIFSQSVSLSGRYLAVKTSGGGGSCTIFECRNNNWVPVKYTPSNVFALNGNLFVSYEYEGSNQKIHIRKKDYAGNWNLVKTIPVNFPNMTNGNYVAKLSVFGSSILAGSGQCSCTYSDRKGQVALFKTNYENWDYYTTDYHGVPNSTENDFYGSCIDLSQYYEVVSSPEGKGTTQIGHVYTKPNDSFIGFQSINEANFTCQSGVHEFKAGDITLGGSYLTYEVKSGADVTYQGNSIKLLNGFKAYSGARFDARTFQTGPILKSANIDSDQILAKKEFTKISNNVLALNIKPITRLTEKRITLYPNPVENVLNVDFNGISIKEISLIDEVGHEIKAFKEPLNKLSINMSGLNNGLYVIKVVYSNNTIENYKVVK